MSFLFGSLFALALAFVAAQPTTDIDPNSTTTTTTTTTTITTTAPVFDQSSDLAGGLTGDQERKGFIVDAKSWGDYNARLEERLNADGLDLRKHADQHPVRLILKEGPQGTYYLVNVNEFSGKFDVMFRLSHRGGPTVYEFLKTLDPDGAAYVTIVGSTQAVTPPPPLYYSSIRGAANWTNTASTLTSNAVQNGLAILILMVGIVMVA